MEDVVQAAEKKVSKKRKRRALEEEERANDIESRYMNKIYSKISKLEPVADPVDEKTEETLPTEVDDELFQHETLTSTSNDAEQTVSISNLPVKVLTWQPLLRSLKQSFSNHAHIKTIRFR